MVKKADTNVCSFEKRTLVFFPCVRPLRWYKIRRANNTSEINSFGCCRICTHSYIFIYTRFRLFIFHLKRQIRKQNKRLFFNTRNDTFSHHHLANTNLVGEFKFLIFLVLHIILKVSILCYLHSFYSLINMESILEICIWESVPTAKFLTCIKTIIFFFFKGGVGTASLHI